MGIPEQEDAEFSVYPNTNNGTFVIRSPIAQLEPIQVLSGWITG